MRKTKIIILTVVMILELCLIGCNKKIIESNVTSNLQEVSSSENISQELANSTNDLQERTDSASNLQEESDQISSIAQDNIGEDPILIIVNNSLIGAYKENEWVDYTSVFGDVDESIEFSVYSNDKYLGLGKVENMNSRELINISGFEDFSEDFIALSNNESALKRMHKMDDAKLHYDILKETLHKQGLNQSVPNVTEAVNVDLDGDGIEELITIGTSYNKEDCIEEWVYKANNNYSIMIYSKIENESYSSEIMGESSRYKIEDLTLEMMDINKDMLIIDEIHYSIIGCLDINNDNIIEVVIKEESFGGAEYRIYEFSNGKFEIVLRDFYGYR